MSNAGTWLVGRLQTENDKARVLEGLRSAAGTTDVAELDKAIGGLGKRQFLLVSAKADAPRLLATRWAMSYLCGPLTKEQVDAAPADGRGAPPRSEPAPARRGDADARRAAGRRSGARADETPVAPPVAAGIAGLVPRPGGPVGLRDRRDGGIDAPAGVPRGARLAPLRRHGRRGRRAGGVRGGLRPARRWPLSGERDAGGLRRPRLLRAPPAGAAYVLPQAPVGEAEFFASTAKDIQRHLVDRRPLELQRNRALKLVSRPGEAPDDFAKRCDAAAQERADAEAAKIRDRLEAKRDRLDKALAQAQRRVEELDTDTRTRQASELISGAGAVLGALFGGRRSTRGRWRARSAAPPHAGA